MIHSFTVTNDLGESLELILAEPEKSGLAIESVTGLGQVGADINMTKLAGSDYYTSNSATLTKRNVVFNIKYFGDDIEVCRHLCDKMFPTKKKISIVAKTDYRELMLSGFVEKNEPDIFSPTSGCQISILCADPFWYSLEPTDTPFGGIEPLFEFPFSSDLSADDTLDTIEFGNIRIIKDKSIYYTGEAEVGITIQVNALGVVRGLTFYNIDTSEQISINDTLLAQIAGNSIQQGDEIIISTVKNNKYATLIRNGVTYNIINALGKTRDWFELSRGDNLFSYSTTEGEYDTIINIKYREAFKGI